MPHTKSMEALVEHLKAQWNNLDKLSGIVVNDSNELKEKLAKANVFVLDTIKKRELNGHGYNIFSAYCQSNGHVHVAYECSKCKKIIIGLPKIDVHPISPEDRRVKEHIESCISCENVLYHREYKH